MWIEVCLEQKATIRERKTKWSYLCDFLFFYYVILSYRLGFPHEEMDEEDKLNKWLVKKNRSYNFCCKLKLYLLHTKSVFEEKNQLFNTTSLYTVGSMYIQRSVVRILALCTVFCLKAQMHWKRQMFMLIQPLFLSFPLLEFWSINRGSKICDFSWVQWSLPYFQVKVVGMSSKTAKISDGV